MPCAKCRIYKFVRRVMFDSNVNDVETQSCECYGVVNNSVPASVVFKMTSVTRTPGIEADLISKVFKSFFNFKLILI